MKNWSIFFFGNLLGILVHAIDAMFSLLLALSCFTPFWSKISKKVFEHKQKHIQKIAKNISEERF